VWVRRRGCFCYIALTAAGPSPIRASTRPPARRAPPPGSVGYEAEVTAKGRAADLAGAALGRKLAAMRAPGRELFGSDHPLEAVGHGSLNGS
jgi:hypothetical protein